MNRKQFAQFVLFALVLNIFIIVWGGFVRATGSGAGCGNHWPACNGEVIPLQGSGKTLIEYTHRITSLMGLICVFAIFFISRKLYQKKEEPRRWASITLFFMIVEALLGAALVLLGLVDKNDTLARALVMSVHLINTCLLLGSMVKLYWNIRVPLGYIHPFVKQNKKALFLGVSLILIAVSGAIAALGDTLFPAQSFYQGLTDELSPTAHVLVRLRIYHPFIAVIVGVFAIWIMYAFQVKASNSKLRWTMLSFLGLYFLQLGIGLLNVGLLAPIWLQMVHLFVSNLIWISFVLWNAQLYASELKFQKVAA